jgi:hypothetical protein
MALEALEAIQGLLVVPHIPGKRKRTVLTKIDGWERRHLEEMSAFLGLYTDSKSKTRGEWTASSVQAAVSRNKGKGGHHGHARSIRECARKNIFSHVKSRFVLCAFSVVFVSLLICSQVNPFGKWAKSKLETHPELADELKEHLASISKYVQAHDIVDFLNRPDIQTKHKLGDAIHLRTAQRWMHALKFCWVKDHKGQYVDGNECTDVVQYRQEVFLLAWYGLEGRMRT